MTRSRTVSRETLVGDVPRETLARLDAFVSLLLEWAPRINLIGRIDGEQLWHRHVADSLQLVPLATGAARAIDLGSGAGFPGLVLAVATGIPFDLIEADARKAVFLTEAARKIAAPVVVHAVRIEKVTVQPAPLITARALASLSTLLAYTHPLLAVGGIALFLKGRSVDAEIEAAQDQWCMKLDRFPSQTDPSGAVLRIRDLHRA